MQIKEGDNKEVSAKFFDFLNFKKRKGQVWIETVIYTLIALTIIGLFLSFAKPKIEEIQDKAVIDQSLVMLEDVDSLIQNMVEGGVGNKRILEVGIKKGTLTIDGENDQIRFELEGRYTYTEPGNDGQPGSPVQIGNVIATTQKKGSMSTVTLISDYTDKYNIKYKGGENTKSISKAPVNYKMSMENKGEQSGLIVMDFNVN